MYLSQKKRRKEQELVAGKTTIGGDAPAVMGYGEMRNACVFAPGGYIWKPRRGDSVLVFKDGKTDILGAECENSDILPGEVCIRSAGGAEILLSNDGNIYIKGNIVTEES